MFDVGLIRLLTCAAADHTAGKLPSTQARGVSTGGGAVGAAGSGGEAGGAAARSSAAAEVVPERYGFWQSAEILFSRQEEGPRIVGRCAGLCQQLWQAVENCEKLSVWHSMLSRMRTLFLSACSSLQQHFCASICCFRVAFGSPASALCRLRRWDWHLWQLVAALIPPLGEHASGSTHLAMCSAYWMQDRPLWSKPPATLGSRTAGLHPTACLLPVQSAAPCKPPSNAYATLQILSACAARAVIFGFAKRAQYELRIEDARQAKVCVTTVTPHGKYPVETSHRLSTLLRKIHVDRWRCCFSLHDEHCLAH